MRDLKNMGVNTIRTWGVDDAQTPVLLNRAAQQGIKVVVGHWLNQGADYVNDTAYKTAVKNEIVARVNTLKNHQGVLMWDVGNEVILTMQDYGLPAADGRGAAGRVRPVRQRGRRRHPRRRPEPPGHLDRRLDRRLAVLQGALPGAGPARGQLLRRDRHRQGRTGSPAATPSRTSSPRAARPASGRSPNDVNGVPKEPTDLEKRAGYTASWNAIKAHPGVALGATEFHYGLENDFGGVWLNTTTGGWRRLGYHALRQAYTGQASANTPPEITAMTVELADRGAGRRHVHRGRRRDRPAGRPDPLQPDVQQQAHQRQPRPDQRDLHRDRRPASSR